MCPHWFGDNRGLGGLNVPLGTSGVTASCHGCWPGAHAGQQDPARVSMPRGPSHHALPPVLAVLSLSSRQHPREAHAGQGGQPRDHERRNLSPVLTPTVCAKWGLALALPQIYQPSGQVRSGSAAWHVCWINTPSKGQTAATTHLQPAQDGQSGTERLGLWQATQGVGSKVLPLKQTPCLTPITGTHPEAGTAPWGTDPLHAARNQETPLYHSEPVGTGGWKDPFHWSLSAAPSRLSQGSLPGKHSREYP